MKEAQKILEELIGSKPEELTGEAKRLFEAIMKIADERDEFEYKYNRAIEDLVKLEKERQADKEKIKELEKENQSKQEQINSKLLKGWELIGKVVEAREQTHKEYIEVIEKNPTKAFILKCKLEAYEDLLKDGGE